MEPFENGDYKTMSTGDTFGFYGYLSDNGNTYGIKMSARVAGLTGFVLESASPLGGTLTMWPWHEHDMRHVTGRAADGTHARIPVATPDHAYYAIGGVFTLNAKTFTITGAEGERRVANHVR